MLSTHGWILRTRKAVVNQFFEQFVSEINGHVFSDVPQLADQESCGLGYNCSACPPISANQPKFATRVCTSYV
jgi:hypothetical protein